MTSQDVAGSTPEDAMTQPARSARSPFRWTLITLLLAVGVAGTLIVPIYARTGPKLGAFPFFYWYQLIWIPIVAILASIAYVLTRRVTADAPRPDQGPPGQGPPGQGPPDQGRPDEGAAR
jgi:hypothetical protein